MPPDIKSCGPLGRESSTPLPSPLMETANNAETTVPEACNGDRPKMSSLVNDESPVLQDKAAGSVECAASGSSGPQNEESYEEQLTSKDLQLALSLHFEELGLSASDSESPPDSRPHVAAESETVLLEWIDKSDSMTDLERFIHCGKENCSPDRPSALDDLANKLDEWWERVQGDGNNLDAEIKYREAVLHFTPPSSPSKLVLRYGNLGASLHERFLRSNDIDDLQLAIMHRTDALLLQNEHGQISKQTMALALSLVERAKFYGKRDDFDWSVECFEKILDLEDKSYYIPALQNLSVVLVERFKRFKGADAMEDLNRAISYEKLLLDKTKSANGRSRRLQTLGACFHARFQETGQPDDLDEAIKYREQSLSLLDARSQEKADYYHNLGVSLNQRIKFSSQHGDFDKSVACHLEAIRLISDTPYESTATAIYHHSLGEALSCRFQRFGKIQDLEDAIRCQQEAVNLTSTSQRMFAVRSNDLGISFHTLYECYGRRTDLDSAISNIQVAYQHPTSVDDPDELSLRHHNLAMCLYGRYAASEADDTTDLLAAVTHSGRAFELLRPSHEYRYLVVMLLGDLLREVSRHSHNKDDLDNAIQYQQEAIETCRLPLEKPRMLSKLGDSFLQRSKYFSQTCSEDRARAFSIYEQATALPEIYPLDSLDLTLDLASFWHTEPMTKESLKTALRHYTKGVALLPRVAWIGLDTTSRLHHLKNIGRANQLGNDAVACAISLSEFDGNHAQQYLQNAVELLEHSHSVIWSEWTRLRADLTGLWKHDPGLANDLEETARRLDIASLGGNRLRLSSAELEDKSGWETIALGIKWDELVQRTRAHPDFEHFLRPPSYEELSQAATKGFVVIVNISSHRCDALVLRHGIPVQPVKLSNLDAANLNCLASDISSTLAQLISYASFALEDQKSAESHAILSAMCQQTLSECSYVLWDKIGGPVLQTLDSTHSNTTASNVSDDSPHRVWWYLTGTLSFLPLHAARPRPESTMTKDMLDCVISSYVHSLSALIRAQQISKEQPQSDFRMLVVGQTEELGSAKKEIEVIRKISRKQRNSFVFLEDSLATVDAVVSELQLCTWAHFICHGFQNVKKPMESGLVMHNDSLLDIAKLVESALTNAEFAMLMACESGQGSKDHANEVIHVAAGLSFAGFRSVIGTMWAMGDQVGPVISKQIYSYLFRDFPVVLPDSAKGASALRKALIYLRDARRAPLFFWMPFIHFGI